MILKRFRFNIFFKFIGEFVSRFSALLFYALGARLLGAEQFGVFSKAHAYALVCVLLIDLGSNNILTRNIARDPNSAKKLIPSFMTFKFLLMPLSLLLVHFTLTLLGVSQTLIRITDLMGLAVFGVAAAEYIAAVLSGLEKMKVEAWLKGVWKGGALLLSCLLFHFFQSLESFIWGMALGQWVGVLVGLVWIHRRVVPLKPQLDFSLVFNLLRASVPVFFGLSLMFLYDKQIIYFLSGFGFSNEDVGVYSAASKLIDALRALPILFMGAAFPIISQAYTQDRALFMKIAKPVLSQPTLFLFPSVCLLSLGGPLLCGIIFGPEYATTGVIFSILIWGFLALFLNHVLAQILLSLEGQRHYLQGAILATVTHGVLCFWLLPTKGIIGGAWAFVLAEGLLFVFSTVMVAIRLGRDKTAFLKEIGYPLVLSLSTVLAIGLAQTIVSFGVALALGFLFYGILAVQFKLLNWELLSRLKS